MVMMSYTTCTSILLLSILLYSVHSDLMIELLNKPQKRTKYVIVWLNCNFKIRISKKRTPLFVSPAHY